MRLSPSIILFLATVTALGPVQAGLGNPEPQLSPNQIIFDKELNKAGLPAIEFLKPEKDNLSPLETVATLPQGTFNPNQQPQNNSNPTLNSSSQLLTQESNISQNPNPPDSPNIPPESDLQLNPTPPESQLQLEGIPTQPPNVPEARVLVAEVVVSGTGLTPELEETVYNAIKTQPGRTTTRSQLQEDVNAVFSTGLFANVTQQPEDTPLGVRITFIVEANPQLSQVVLSTLPDDAKPVIPQTVVDDIFKDQYGEILNLRSLRDSILRLNEWYQKNGYDLAQVIDTPRVAPDGTVTLQVAEGVIEAINVRFLNEDDEVVEGNQGNTRPFIVTREMQLAPGTVFQRDRAQADLQRVFALGLFDDAKLSFSPGSTPAQVVVNMDVVEGNAGSVAAGAGFSSASGFFGSLSYQQKNVGGNDQDLTGEIQIGQREFLFDVNFTDPWIGGDPFRTSYTVNGFRRRTISLIFDGGSPDIRLPNGDRPRVLRTGGGVTFSRPLAPDPFSRAEWTLNAGFQYQGISIRDGDGDLSQKDSLGNLLSFAPGGRDTLATISLGAVQDKRNSILQPTQGSILRFGVDQSIPIGASQIFMTRLRGSYSYYFPVNFISFTKDPKATGQALAFNIQGGTVMGDLPPYEAFSLGGSNSVRGYGEGEVGSGRSYLQATAEYRFPILSFLNAAFFLDYGTDLGTGDNVPGNPAGIRNKPGDGFGYGIGIRVQSPLGPIRVDYGFNDQGDSRIHFGIGERF